MTQQPNATQTEAPTEDPGAWSLGAAALMLVLFFGAQLVMMVAVGAVVYLANPHGVAERLTRAFTSGTVVGAVVFASDALFLLAGYLIWVYPARRPLRPSIALLPSRVPLWATVPVALVTGLTLDGLSLLFKQPISPPIMGVLLSSPLAIAVLTLALVTVVPLTEEIYFRGVLWAAVRRRAGLPLAVVITSAVFAVVHLTTYGMMGVVLFQAFVIGAVLALLRSRAGSIVPCVLTHAVLNLLATVEFLLLGR